MIRWLYLKIDALIWRPRLRILRFLAERDEGRELYGLTFVAAGVAKRGTVYLHLHALEDAGLVSSREEAVGDPLRCGTPRRLYRITEAGRWMVPTPREERLP